ncbi:unnamed protein product [Camellia sinensis]
MTESNKRGCCVNGKGSGVQEQQQRRRRRRSSVVVIGGAALASSSATSTSQRKSQIQREEIPLGQYQYQPKADKEFKRIWDFKREKNGQINGDLDPWDEAYFTRLMKSSAYSLDSLVVASYFPLTQCIEGLKVLVELLFGVTFRSIPLAPRESWHTDVLKMSLYHPKEVFASSLLAQSEKPVVGALYKSGGADSPKLSVVAKFKCRFNIYDSWDMHEEMITNLEEFYKTVF